MKKLICLCFAVALISISFSVFAERTILKPPIPKPKISIEEALKLARAENFKGMDDDAIKSSPIIIDSVEYRSYHYIKETYSGDIGTIAKFSNDGNWEWLIKFSDTRMTDRYSIYMVTENGVHLIDLCCV